MTRCCRGSAEDIGLLAELWRCWAEASRDAPAAVWAQPGLGVWSVKELYAHVSRGAATAAELIGRATEGTPEMPNASCYFGRLMAAGVRPDEQVARLAKERAARHSVPALAGAFGQAAAPVFEAARRHPDRLVTTVVGTMCTADYLVTRAVEATVHLMDFATVVPGAPVPPPGALDRTAAVLAGLADPADLIRLATGRPGPAVFPVLC
ncbi:maleylpyruvate isomerase N-terminal domain-containing protein [Amycolatopsis jejuensis]|uniref:maleylpyruvate isomerase N-terminal domain-containing protein n=1 Tax=Amycolatopsis jejuensis TaxID=330084 RepID=UPI00068CED67|nr:maleylpyruvate isomerase N-terminal domain-containing protein [Amycolatopsis jejuensis]